MVKSWEREGRRGKGKIARKTGRLIRKDKNMDQGTTKGTGKVGKGKGRRMYGECREGKGKN